MSAVCDPEVGELGGLEVSPLFVEDDDVVGIEDVEELGEEDEVELAPPGSESGGSRGLSV